MRAERSGLQFAPLAGIAGHTLHLIQRGHLRVACFFCERDRSFYLAEMGICAERLMRVLGERYARYIADTHLRAAPLLEERFEASALRSRRHLLACMRYIELNPVRAGLVATPGEYPWSSFRANALGKDDALVTPHSHYCSLGRTAVSRQEAYRGLFPAGLEVVAGAAMTRAAD